MLEEEGVSRKLHCQDGLMVIIILHTPLVDHHFATRSCFVSDIFSTLGWRNNSSNVKFQSFCWK